MQETIGKLYNYAPLAVRKAAHSAYEAGLTKQDCMVDQRALVGIEVEIENCPEYFVLPYYWSTIEDNSLRNNGREYVSIPMRAYQVPYALDHLFHYVSSYNPKFDFSPRTSIHVHLNVRDLTWEQVKTLTLLYAIFEKHFFHIAGTKREESIFCVPLYKTAQLDHLMLLDHPIAVAENWNKYNAINLQPIAKYGTVEFRHLYGTDNKQVIINWINNILSLRKVCVKLSLDELLEKIKQLNTTSEYIALYSEIFGDLADLGKMQKYDFESCISYTKQSLWGIEGLKQYPTSFSSSLANFLSGKKEQQKENPVKVYLDEIAVAEAVKNHIKTLNNHKYVNANFWDQPITVAMPPTPEVDF